MVQKTLDVIRTIKETLVIEELQASPALQNKAYTELLMRETTHEKHLKDEVEKRKDLSDETKKEHIKKLEDTGTSNF